MPQIFKIGSYTVYFWSNEGKPLEPIHVHIAEGRATAAGLFRKELVCMVTYSDLFAFVSMICSIVTLVVTLIRHKK